MLAYCGRPRSSIFLRSFPLNRHTLFAGNDRRNLLDLGRLATAIISQTGS